MVSNQDKTDIGHDNPSLDLNGEKSNGHMTKDQVMQEQHQEDQLLHDQQICKEGKSESQVILILSGDDLFEDLPAPGIIKYSKVFKHNLEPS